MKILIDNGHGVNTPGKRSPKGGDKGMLYEWKWAREIAKPVVEKLKEKGYDAELIVTEDIDISLGERCRRVNKWCDKLGSKNCLFVSVHANASGNCVKWEEPNGWCEFVYTKASSRSKQLGQCLYAEAEKRGLKGNRSVPDEKYWTANFYALKHTQCPAVLTENLFYDNKKDYEYMMSDKGKAEIVDIHVEGIINYIKKQQA